MKKFNTARNKMQRVINNIIAVTFTIAWYLQANKLEFDTISQKDFVTNIITYGLKIFVIWCILSTINKIITKRLFPNKKKSFFYIAKTEQFIKIKLF